MRQQTVTYASTGTAVAALVLTMAGSSPSSSVFDPADTATHEGCTVVVDRLADDVRHLGALAVDTQQLLVDEQATTARLRARIERLKGARR